MSLPKEITGIFPERFCPKTDTSIETWRALPTAIQKTVLETLALLKQFSDKGSFFQSFTLKEARQAASQIGQIATRVFPYQNSQDHFKPPSVAEKEWQKRCLLAQAISELAKDFTLAAIPKANRGIFGHPLAIEWDLAVRASEIAGRAASWPIYSPKNHIEIINPYFYFLQILGLGVMEVKMVNFKGTDRLVSHLPILRRSPPAAGEENFVFGCLAVGPNGQGDQQLTHFHPIGYNNCDQRAPLKNIP